MPDSPSTLRDYLRNEDPLLDISRCRGGKNTTCGKTPWDRPWKIERWIDFEDDALDSVYGGALHNVLKQRFDLNHPDVPQKPFCQITNEDSFTSLLVKWNQSIVSSTLATAHESIKSHFPHERIYMFRGSQAQSPGANSRLRPDWAGVKVSMEPSVGLDVKPENLLPGDTKLSGKWSSADMVLGNVTHSLRKSNWFQPLSQVYTYCTRANARYGYIITDKELVAFRVRPGVCDSSFNSRVTLEKLNAILNSDLRAASTKFEHIEAGKKSPAFRARANGILEYKTIPWQSCTSEQLRKSERLTVNLALWWLHILAADNNAIEESYPALKDTVWRNSSTSQSSKVFASGCSQKRRRFTEKAQISKLTMNLEPRARKRGRMDGNIPDVVSCRSSQRRKTVELDRS